MAGDPLFDSVVLLLRRDKYGRVTDQGAARRSISGRTIVPVGSQYAGAMALDGATCDISVPSSTDFDFGSGDGTIDFLVKSTQADAGATLLTREWVSAPWVGGLSVQFNGPGGGPTVYWADYSTSAPLLQYRTSSHRDGNRHHIEWSWTGGTHRLFFDGVLVASNATTSAFQPASKNITVGNDHTFAPRWFKGDLQARVTKGVARHSEAFDPPTDFDAFFAPLSVSGTIRDAAGAPCARIVRVYDRITGDLVDASQSDPVTGVYTLATASATEHQRIVLDDSAGALENDLIDRVFPG